MRLGADAVGGGCGSVLLRSRDNFVVPFPLRSRRRLRVSLNCKRRRRPRSKARFGRRNMSLLAGKGPLCTVTSNVVVNTKRSDVRRSCVVTGCKGCRIGCNRLVRTCYPCKAIVGTKRRVNGDNPFLRLRIEFSKAAISPVRFLSVV